MDQKQPPVPNKKKQSRMEQLWLSYYNDTLYKQGVITEEQRNKMRIKIKSRGKAQER